ncbi:uncharacterized protein LOC121857798 isoform X2 [Homarus americanus]|uniref:uncharacterized protein LOC121857798 isoform X2 n=1 Tax=Homarus americanus TaxID=6706 RepID=UPI001C4888F9|nr:uncharacterized protein LOC121857798 isoform X2 [Homarus americanus]
MSVIRIHRYHLPGGTPRHASRIMGVLVIVATTSIMWVQHRLPLPPIIAHHQDHPEMFISDQIQKKPEDNFSKTQEELLALTPSRGYTQPGCNCIRFGFDVAALRKTSQSVLEKPWLYPAWFKTKYSFQGESTCSHFSTQRGRQRVVSFSYYNPNSTTDIDSTHFMSYLWPVRVLALKVATLYPGWVMRVYHNVTTDDYYGNSFLCKIYCSNDNVDLCLVTDLPGLGNLVQQQVVGGLWRLAVMGDPTVEVFLSRDLDNWILKREVAAVDEWIKSGRSFHVMRDHPNHTAVMLPARRSTA